MTTKNEALELAQELEVAHLGHADEGPTAFSEAAAMLRYQAAEIERLTSDRDVWKARAEFSYFERDQLKAKNEKLVEASTFALELLDFIRKGCESGAVKSKPFITPDPDAKSLELMTIHGECVKAIKALKENT